MTDPAAAIVRVLAPDGTTAGTGFLVTRDGLILTCTHVVEAAARGYDEVDVVFVQGDNGGRVLRARLEPGLTRPADQEDIACLRLVSADSETLAPTTLGTSTTSVGRTYRTFGFPAAKPVEGMAGEVYVTGRTVEGGFPVLQLRSNEVSLGFSGAPIWDDDFGVVAGMVVSTIPAGIDPAGKQSEVSFVRPVETILEVCPVLRPTTDCPYRGLEIFQEKDADFYFGRDEAARLLVQKIAAEHFVALIGVSGSGKSSLLRAGLQRAFADVAVPGLADRIRCVFSPGREPLLDLTLAVARSAGKEPAAAEYGEVVDDEAVEVVAQRVRSAASSGLLLVVDQFERLFTECRDDQIRRRFVDVLLATASEEVKVVVAVRADFFGAALSHSGVARAVGPEGRGQLTLLPMTDRELREAIEEPARQLNRTFEPRLTDRLVDDVGGHAGDLPLLQFALTELWALEAADGVFTLEAYEHLGYRGADGLLFPGLQGAIAARAEDEWKLLDDTQRAATRRVFLALVAAEAGGDGAGPIGTEASRRAWQTELDAEARKAAETLAQARLVTTGRDPSSNQATVEVAHEALLRAWPRLNGWITNYRPFIRWREQDVVPFWRRWMENGETDDLLLPTALVGEARRWLADYPEELSGPVGDYVRSSIDVRAAEAAQREAELEKAQAQNRKLRLLSAALGVLLLVAIAASVIAWRQTARASHERQVARSRGIAAQAREAMGRNLRLGSLLALEALRASPTAEARSAVMDAVARTDGVSAILPLRPGAEASSVAFSPRDGMIAVGDENRTVRVWRIADRRLLRTLVVDDPFLPSVDEAFFSPDGKTLAGITRGNGGVTLWSLEGRNRQGFRLPAEGQSAAFSPDGTRLVAAEWNGRITVWNAHTYEQVSEVRPAETGRDSLGFGALHNFFVAFTHGKRSVVGIDDRTITVWTVSSRTKNTFSHGIDGVETAAFTADGNRAAIVGSDGSVSVWKLDDRPSLISRPVRSDATTAALTRRGTLLATVSKAGEVSVWRLPSDDVHNTRLVRRIVGTRDTAVVGFDSSGTGLAAGGAGAVTVWHTEGRWLAEPMGGGGDSLSELAISPDGMTLAFSNDANELVRRDLRSGASAVSNGLYADDLAFSPDSRILASAEGSDGLSFWRRGNTKPEPPFGTDVTSLAFSRDGSTIATGGDADSGRVRLWDVATGKQLGPAVRRDGHVVWAVAVSPDGSTIASGGFGKVVSLWPVDRSGQKPRLVAANAPLLEHGDTISSIEFSPTGDLVASAAFDGSIKIWNYRRASMVADIEVDKSGVNDIAFSDDGKTIAAALRNGSVALVDVASTRLLAEPMPAYEDEATEVAFLPDDAALLSIGAGQLLRWRPVWAPNVDALRERLCAIVSRNLTAQEWAGFLDGKRHRTCERWPS